MNLREDKVLVGVITGILVPIVSYGLLTLIYSLFTSIGLMDPDGFSASWRLRTTLLLAICSNLIPFNLHNKAQHAQAMRGLIFPTVIMVVIWVFMFRDVIFRTGQ
jgi:hypothetical protein